MTDKPPPSAESVAMLRHTLATLVYRSAKALRDAPEGFAGFRPFEATRSPLEILAHMGDLLDWALSFARGEPKWNHSPPLEWDEECQRYFAAAEALDGYLASDEAVHRRPERMFQGPIADALTHTGQLTMLRRMAGSPVRAENYYSARIEVGRVGADQAEPAMEFG